MLQIDRFTSDPEMGVAAPISCDKAILQQLTLSYSRRAPSDWVFASVRTHGRTPRVGNMLASDHLRPDKRSLQSKSLTREPLLLRCSSFPLQDLTVQPARSTRLERPTGGGPESPQSTHRASSHRQTKI